MVYSASRDVLGGRSLRRAFRRRETTGLAAAEKIKKHFDTRWDPSWHVIIGRNFGAFVTHETT